MDEPKEKDRYDTLFVDAGGRVHTSRESAIEGSLAFEQASGTGVGCGQSPENVSSGESSGGNESSGESGSDK